MPGDAVEAPYKNTFCDENHILTIDVTSHTEVTSIIVENAHEKKKRKKGRKKISILCRHERERGARGARAREKDTDAH